MTTIATITEPNPATPVVRGTLYKFLPLPVMPQHAKWFEAGPVSFALEIRALPDDDGQPGERSISIHVFTPDREREMVRFDCFDRFPHYHYILNDTQENIGWGYDPVANGPMLDWSFNAIRNRLPAFLRGAGEDDVAAEVEARGLESCVIDDLRRTIDEWEPSLPSDEIINEGKEWYLRWKEIHPQFNTDTGQQFL